MENFALEPQFLPEYLSASLAKKILFAGSAVCIFGKSVGEKDFTFCKVVSLEAFKLYGYVTVQPQLHRLPEFITLLCMFFVETLKTNEKISTVKPP